MRDGGIPTLMYSRGSASSPNSYKIDIYTYRYSTYDSPEIYAEQDTTGFHLDGYLRLWKS
jgi:hypothetical protein